MIPRSVVDGIKAQRTKDQIFLISQLDMRKAVWNDKIVATKTQLSLSWDEDLFS